MGKHIFNILSEYRALLDEIENNAGELTPELEEKLVINEEELEQKCEAYISIRAELKGEIAVIDDEIQRLQALKSSKENSINKLEEYLKLALITYGEEGKSGNKKLTIGTHKLWNVYTKPVIISTDFKDIEGRYINFKINGTLTKQQFERLCNIVANEDFVLEVEDSINKKELRNDLLNGITIEGATLDTDANYIRIQ